MCIVKFINPPFLFTIIENRNGDIYMSQTSKLVNPGFGKLLDSLDEALDRAEAEKVIDKAVRKQIVETITNMHFAMAVKARELLEMLEFGERLLLLVCSRCPKFRAKGCPGYTGWGGSKIQRVPTRENPRCDIRGSPEHYLGRAG